MNYPKSVKDIKNLNDFIREARKLETDKYWSNILYDCSSANYSDWTRRESPLKWKREMIQKYLNYKNNKLEESNKKLILYHNTTNENAIKINKEGITPGLKQFAYGEGSEGEGQGIWCRDYRTYGNGGATITFEIDKNDEALWKANDTEYVVYRNIKPNEIIDIDLMISNIPTAHKVKDGINSTVESDIPEVIKQWGKDKFINVMSRNTKHFVEPYNLVQLQHLIDTGEKYCKGRIKIVESANRLLNRIPKNQKHKVKDFYKDGMGQYTIDLNDGYETSYGTNYIQCKTIKDCLQELENLVEDKLQEKAETKLVDMTKLPYIQQELESRSESEYYKNILDKYNKSKSKRIKLSYSELDDISAIYNGDEEIQKLLYGNKLQEKASIDWNNYLTKLDVQRILRSKDSDKTIKDLVNSRKFNELYKKEFKQSGWTKSNLENDIKKFKQFNHFITESKHKLEEKTRNELLAKTKSQTITRYNKAEGYKGFYIYDIDTTNIFNKDSNMLITCKVGDYHSQVEIENVIWWVEYEVDERGHDTQITTKYVTQALMDAIDGMNIKVNCECGDWIYRMKYAATQYGYNYGRPENRPAKITNPENLGALCKHITAMLSNKKWLQQVTSTLMDYIVKNIDKVNQFLNRKPGQELTVPNEAQRRLGKQAAYSKLLSRQEVLQNAADDFIKEVGDKVFTQNINLDDDLKRFINNSDSYNWQKIQPNEFRVIKGYIDNYIKNNSKDVNN